MVLLLLIFFSKIIQETMFSNFLWLQIRETNDASDSEPQGSCELHVINNLFFFFWSVCFQHIKHQRCCHIRGSGDPAVKRDRKAGVAG